MAMLPAMLRRGVPLRRRGHCRRGVSEPAGLRARRRHDRVQPVYREGKRILRSRTGSDHLRAGFFFVDLDLLRGLAFGALGLGGGAGFGASSRGGPGGAGADAAGPVAGAAGTTPRARRSARKVSAAVAREPGSGAWDSSMMRM